MKKLLSLCLALVLAFALFGCGTPTAPSESPSASQPASTASASPSSGAAANLTILAAASLTQPLDDIIAAYKTVAPNVTITPSYASSGALQTQIEQGAPADIFFSAATKQMDALDQGGLIVTSSKVDLLKNEIVLIVPKDAPVKVGGFGDVATDAVSKIALGDPKSVPAGQYAQDTFNYLNLWDTVSAKATYGSDVKQVLSWVDSGNVDCGIVYKTDALTDENVKVIAEAPNGSHTPVVYPLAIVKASTNQDAAAAFIKYLQSDDALSVFDKYGFVTK
ncbi:molybdate transport system substrate-binding protein [Sporobacter termitidis DSM 10068]|uniref:Molybdate transport system substrate-binding protein n=1 Tax=Sporobacter termitidis DSM 10068 TaxID=1123282 RepID=A0A1M5TXN9_9FIRM|nr:molybdate ABC transporter substrate-binding protein [Sporobacter termitidis]SHH55380.1 molybdate transport system substrate-binding protein [Sporobacter termitidis DSM 10068]